MAGSSQVSADLMGEAAILHLETGVYYGLNEVGARIWNLLQDPVTGSEIKSAILAEYDVPPHICERDICSLLGKLLSANLVQVCELPEPVLSTLK